MKKLLIIFLIFFPSSTWAFWTVGSGLTKCDKFLKDKEKSLLYFQMRGWIQGYITGRNEENNFSKEISIDEIYYHTKSYCSKYPNKEVIDGSKDYYDNFYKNEKTPKF